MGDLLLLGLAGWIIYQSPEPFALWPLTFTVGCVVVGAWICVIPFLGDYRAAVKLAEAQALHSVTDKINELEEVGRQVA